MHRRTASRHPAPSSARAPSFAPGAEGIGDPYFPTYGNGGYDVAGYDLKLRYDPASGRLERHRHHHRHRDAGPVRLQPRPGPPDRAARSPSTDGRRSSKADGNELVVTPAAGIVDGAAVHRRRRLRAACRSRSANEALGVGGWLRTADGGFALGQPESASTWFPVNDHPSDKATFKLAMTVPDGRRGDQQRRARARAARADGWTTWTWTEGAPMASYLATVVIGQYRVTSSTHDGKPMVIAIPESLPADGPAAQSIARTGEVADFLATQFGPYPFDAYGGVVLDDDRVGYALETQTRPVYGNTFFRGGPNTTVVAHELAHQWFGDSVALRTLAGHLAQRGLRHVRRMAVAGARGRGAPCSRASTATTPASTGREPPGDPGADRACSAPAVYQRGAMTVHALRRTIGDAGVLRAAQVVDRPSSATATRTTEEFIAAAEKVSGKDLDAVLRRLAVRHDPAAAPLTATC